MMWTVTGKVGERVIPEFQVVASSPAVAGELAVRILTAGRVLLAPIRLNLARGENSAGEGFELVCLRGSDPVPEGTTTVHKFVGADSVSREAPVNG